ncbi:MAG TPA: hypothetical protein VKL99_01030 [Candidatus Angelobacter sp.]|nr:hypothetical protein [Candidatus Angelobacter sp.]
METDDMKPGDTRTFKKGDGNAVVLAAGIWAERRGRQLHIHITGTPTFHTTVTNDPESERYHRTLFRDLRRVLVENHCWPFGNEGSETEGKRASLPDRT